MMKIAFGTDSAVTKHGENADEFTYMVENVMIPMEAIYAATIASADLINKFR